MEKFIPENFRERLASVAFLVGLLYSFVSLNERKREHALRLTAMVFIFGISLLANNWACYFAAILVIAMRTQLEFLQNVAAIIRGSKEYFDYAKCHQTPKEVQEKIKKDTEEIEQAVQ